MSWGFLATSAAEFLPEEVGELVERSETPFDDWATRVARRSKSTRYSLPLETPDIEDIVSQPASPVRRVKDRNRIFQRRGRMPKVYKSSKFSKIVKRRRSDRDVAKIAKRVMLRNVETKQVIRSLGNRNVNHNTWENLSKNVLYTQLGVNDGNSLTSRIGDEITLVGIKLYMSFEQYTGTPFTTYRVLIARVRDGYSSNAAPQLLTVTGNNMIDPVDTEKIISVVFDRRYRPGGQNSITSLTSGGGGATEIAFSKPATEFTTVYIPLKYQKYKYDGGSFDVGLQYNLAAWVCCYDQQSQAIATDVGKFTMATQLFFKDA